MDSMLRQIIDINPHFVFVKDRQGRFTLVNRALADAYGTSVDELIGKTDADFNPNLAEVEWFRRDDLEVMDTLREKLIPEEVVTDADGNVRLLQTTKRPLVDPDGVARHVLGVSIDITALKKAEEGRRELQGQMLRAQKLESLGVLAGGIAHDFNNLLVGVLANTDLALHVVSKDSPSGHALQQIRIAARRAAELCRDMLAYSGGGRMALEDVDLGELAGELVHLLEASISKKADLVMDIRRPLASVRGDASQLHQVLMNLITNASDSLGAGSGRITVTIRAGECTAEELQENCTHDVLPAGCYVFVEVADTGSGMDEGTMARMFDPFFSTKVAGRGLGLAAVLGIVRGHGGGLRVRSQPGDGTCFTICFPAIDAPVKSRGAPEETSAEVPDTGRILVVDDEPIVVSVVRELLGLHGLSVVAATDGEQAVDIFREQWKEITGVLLDLTMPKQDGYEVLGELRQIRPDVPVVLMSGFDEKDTAARTVDDPPAGFLRKPFEEAELLGAMSKLHAAGPDPD